MPQSRIVREINFLANHTCERSSDLWRMVQILRFRNTRLLGQIVSPSHHLVLEGYPRCGNSFALRWFLYANGFKRSWSIATHFHRFSQIELAIRWQIPTAVFIRNPKDAVVSRCALGVQKGKVTIASDKQAIRELQIGFLEYKRFVDQVVAIQDQVVVADFHTTTTNIAAVFDALNERYATDYLCLSEGSDPRQEIFATGGGHLSPNPERERIKDRFVALIQVPDCRGLYASAVKAFEQVKNFRGEYAYLCEECYLE